MKQNVIVGFEFIYCQIVVFTIVYVSILEYKMYVFYTVTFVRIRLDSKIDYLGVSMIYFKMYFYLLSTSSYFNAMTLKIIRQINNQVKVNLHIFLFIVLYKKIFLQMIYIHIN